MFHALRLALIGLAFSILGCASTIAGTATAEDAAPLVDTSTTDTGSADHADAPSIEVGPDVVDASVPDATRVDTSPDVVPHGTLVVMPGNMPHATILVASGDVWYRMADYRLMALGEAQSVDYARLASISGAASFARVAVAHDGRVIGSGILPSVREPEVDVSLSTPLILPVGDAVPIQLWGQLSPVVAHSSVTRTDEVPLSGNLVGLTITTGRRSTSTIWDSPEYEGMMDIHSVGVSSREVIRGRLEGSAFTTAFVVRKSKPTVVISSPPSARIPSMPGEEFELLRFQVAADTAGPIAFKAAQFRTVIRRDVTSTFSLAMPVLYQGTRPVDPGEYRLIPIIHEGPEPFAAGETDFLLMFTNERIITGSGYAFSFRTHAQGTSVSGDSVLVGFDQAATPVALVTGRLVGGGAGVTVLPEGVWGGMNGVFIWSDVSDVPHTDRLDRSSSYDWTNEYLLEDLTRTFNLYVP